MRIRCIWCGWVGDEDEHDEPMYCPECGHTNFDIKPDKKEEEKHEQ